MDANLRKKLIGAAGAGALALAGVMTGWFEGRVYVPYRDPVGIWTVCEGITGPDVVQNKRYTDPECDALRDKHLQIADAAVGRQIHVPLNKFQRAALIDWTFNLGEARLASSTLARKFNAGDYASGCAEVTQWVKARVKGQLITLKGLVTRRDAEYELCMGLV